MNRDIKKIKSKILKKNNVVRAGIFGSFARGEQKKNSDIDILVEIKAKKFSLFDLVAMKLEMEDALGKKIDLVEYSVIKPLIKKEILNEEIRII